MKKILAFILAVVGVFSVASCVKEAPVFTKDGKTPLEAPAITAGEITSNSISFYWTAVDNAGLYYYKVLNPAGYVVAKGETRQTSVLVKGLKFGTDFSVQVSAVPAADFAKTYCSSEPAVAVITTETPVVIDYEWVLPGKAWFYSGEDQWNKSNVTVGLEKGTNHFIVTSWCGAEGFDFYFYFTDFDGSYPLEFDSNKKNMKALEGQAIDTQGPIGSRPDYYLAHGLGGKTQDYNVFYGDGGSYEYGVIDTSGGYIDFWTTNFDAQWCGYRVEFGDYKAPEPEPWSPDPDMSADWSATGEINIGGAPTGTYAEISYVAAERKYTISNWYGAEGYDLSFTRNEEDGKWILDPASSAYTSECPGDGLVGLLHGTEGAKLIWVNTTDAESGLEGDDASGRVWLDITAPSGEAARYSLVWPAILSNGDLDYDWERTASFEFDGTTGKAKVSYEAATGTYTISDWLGVEGLSIVFTRSLEGFWQIDREASTAYVMEGSYDDIGINSGIEGAATVWFHEDYAGMTGDDKEGSLYITGWSHKSNWTTYTLYWSDEDYTVTGTVTSESAGLNFETTLSYDAATKKYTLAKWFGGEWDLVFTVAGGRVVIDDESEAFVSYSDYNDRWRVNTAEGKYIAEIFYTPVESTLFTGGSAHGTLMFGGIIGNTSWFWDGTVWGDYKFEW